MRLTILSLLALAFAPRAVAQASAQSPAPPVASYSWAGTNLSVYASVDSGVVVAISQGTMSDATWFVPARVIEWSDSMAAALLQPASSPAGAWVKFGHAVRSTNGRKGLGVFRSGTVDSAMFRLAFDAGGLNDAITVDLSQPQLTHLLASMRTAAARGAFLADSGPSRVYFEYQVTKPVLVRNANPVPGVPRSFLGNPREGSALIQFVVDTSGKADMSTYKVIRASDMKFADELKRVLPQWTFWPAERNGRRVAQYVQLPMTWAVPR